MMRARRKRIVAFMRRERADCLAEINWLLRTYNCEVLGCPLEDYPARLLPTLPPGYEDLLNERQRRVNKFIYPVSLEMILLNEFPRPRASCYPPVSSQPDSGVHQAEANSISPECDPSPRLAAVVTGSVEPETPLPSPAISTGLPGATPEEEVKIDNGILSLEDRKDSTDGYSNHVSLQEQYIWIRTRQHYFLRQLDQLSVGAADEKETTTTNQQATAREEFAKPTKKQQRQRRDWGIAQYQQFDRGKLL